MPPPTEQPSRRPRYLATAYVPGRETLVEGVFEVLPGEQVTCTPDGHLTRRPFWQLPADGLSRASEAELRQELRRLLERATRRLLPPPGEPVGATLSGGVDSSLVVALARRLHDAPVHTWSVSFGERYPLRERNITSISSQSKGRRAQ